MPASRLRILHKAFSVALRKDAGDPAKPAQPYHGPVAAIRGSTFRPAVGSGLEIGVQQVGFDRIIRLRPHEPSADGGGSDLRPGRERTSLDLPDP